jgi:hypothetical protein
MFCQKATKNEQHSICSVAKFLVSPFLQTNKKQQLPRYVYPTSCINFIIFDILGQNFINRKNNIFATLDRMLMGKDY